MNIIIVLIFALSSYALAVSECNFEDSTKTLSCKVQNLRSGLSSGLSDGKLQEELHKAEAISIKCQTSMLSHLPFQKGDVLLKYGHFGNLPNLLKLEIVDCPISSIAKGAFTGLRRLSSLSIRGFVSEWPTTMLELESGAFDHLEHLESLDLSSNNLVTLPAALPCQLKTIRTFNLSRNNFNDFPFIFDDTETCNIKIDTLDLSGNRIKKLNDEAFDSFPISSLRVLLISGNRLDFIGNSSLQNLSSLEELDLSDNQLKYLPRNVFKHNPLMKSLKLHRNDLEILHTNLFQPLTELLVLNLSQNALTVEHMDASVFADLKSLQVLSLSHNKIVKIDQEVLKPLSNLRVLDLTGNQIASIDNESFLNLTNLETLKLTANQLTSVDTEIEPLVNLKSLFLDSNHLQHFGISGYLPNLKNLALNNNFLLEVPDLTSLTRPLVTLDLGENDIEVLRDNAFSTTPELYGLRLSGNRIKYVSNSTFNNASNVHILNLADNEISDIEVAAFHQMESLRALRLDGNKIHDMNGLISTLERLQWLNISSNSIQWFDLAFLSQSLEWLDMSDNDVTKIGNFYGLANFKLKTLNLNSNNIKSIEASSLPSSIEIVHLKENKIEQIESFSFAGADNLKWIDLRKNKLTSITQAELEISSADKPELFLSGNPLICNCHMGWMSDVIHDRSSQAMLPFISDRNQLECMLPKSKEVVPLSLALPEDFLCSYQTHCSADCMCCDFYACDCRSQCPEGCECFHDQDWSQNIVTCSSRQHQFVPLLLPVDATKIQLDGNNFRHLETQSFLGRDNVKELYLNNSGITSLSNQTFYGLENLEILHLELNSLQSLQGEEFKGLGNLKELYLHNNMLRTITEEVFKALPSLITLTLDGNLLSNFPVWSLMENHHLSALTLAYNNWPCTCDFIKPFNFFLDQMSRVVKDYDLIQCVSDNALDESAIRKGDISCSTSEIVDMDRSANNEPKVSLLLILLPVMVVIPVLVILALFVFRKSWIQRFFPRRVEDTACQVKSISATVNDVQNNKLFDVYISYALQDRAQVEGDLVPAMERQSYKVCLHHRDFPPSLAINDAISVAAESSSRIMIFLTRSYLQSEWIFVKTHLLNGLRGDAAHRLIFILGDNLSSNELRSYPDLCDLVQRCFSIPLRSPRFYVQLQQALPESSFATFQRNVRARNQMRHSLVSGLTNSSNHEDMYSLDANNPYQAITDNHIYQAIVDKSAPIQFVRQQNSNLLVLGAQLSSSLNSPGPVEENIFHHHVHTPSATSATQLLPAESSAEHLV